MEKERISTFLADITVKLETSNQSFDPIWRLRGLMDHSTRLLERLRSRNLQKDNNIVIHLIEDFQELSTKTYAQLFDLLESTQGLDTDTKAIKGERLVNRLSRELRYIESLAIAVLENDNYYLGNNEDNLSWFDNVVSLAANDLDVDRRGLLVLFNLYQTLGLRSFTYTKEFRTLDVPVTVLYTPWEWSVIWHEIAGIKVKEIKKRIPDFIKDALTAVHTRVQNKSDWTEDYLEEIFEDACSVLVFGEKFIPIFEKILNRTYAEPLSGDTRHPSVSTRINMAKLLLGQIVEEATQDQKEAASVINSHMSDFLPSQKGVFQNGDPHSIIMDAMTTYEVSPQDGFRIFQETRSAFSISNIAIPMLTRSAKQVDLRHVELPIDPNSDFIEIGTTKLVLFNKFTNIAAKIEKLLNLNFSESDLMSPAEHKDDPSHSNKVSVVYPTEHGEHTHRHKH